MEFDGLFEDLDLCALANNGAIGLEYYVRNRHLDENGQFLPKIKAMIEGTSKLTAALLRGIRAFRKKEITPRELLDHDRGRRFLLAGRRTIGFDPGFWQERARGLKAEIKRILDGEQLNEDEIKNLQGFLLETSDLLWKSIHTEQVVFLDNRGIHHI